MVSDRFRKRTENYALLGQLFLERGSHGDAVKHRVHRHTRQHLLFLQRDPQLFVGTQDLRVKLIQALQARLLLRRRVINHVLIIDRRELHIRPGRLGMRLFQRRPVTVRFQPPLQHELRLVLLGRDDTHDLFIQPLGDSLRFNVGDEAPLVVALGQVTNGIYARAHCILPDIVLVVVTLLPFASRMAINCIGRIRSESMTLSSAPRTTWLITLWLSRMEQESSRSQRLPDSRLHSVKASGPSIAAMISASEIRCGSRARLYPPLVPRCEASSP